MRASVPPRDTSLFKRQGDEGLGIEQSEYKPERAATEKQKRAVINEPAQNLVSFTLRVEDSVDKALKSLCTAESITKETFLEAAYLVCSENAQMMQQVLEVAKVRRQERRNAGNLRRAEAMTRYLPENSEKLK
jgi:rubrerythrin